MQEHRSVQAYGDVAPWDQVDVRTRGRAVLYVYQHEARDQPQEVLGGPSELGDVHRSAGDHAGEHEESVRPQGVRDRPAQDHRPVNKPP